jgi:hypothetical protein
MRIYKLTDNGGYTRRGQIGETKWEIGKTITATGAGHALCTDGVIHGYISPEIAVFMNPVHANLDCATMRLFEGDADAIVTDDGTKVGVKSLTLTREIPVIVISTEERVEIAIRIALEFYKDTNFHAWADAWLSGIDRSANAAGGVERAAQLTNIIKTVIGE